MRLRIKKRFVFLLVLACISFFSVSATGLLKIGSAVAHSSVQVKADAAILEAKGKQFYVTGQWQQAVNLWEQATQVYIAQQNPIGHSRVLSNLALAYQHLGNWQQAQQAIEQSLELLEESQAIARESNRDSLSKTIGDRVLAQTLNNQGILQLARGNPQAALTTWKEATEVYERIGDSLGVTRSQINQGSAFKALGLYRRALKVLEQVNQTLAQQTDSAVKAVALRSYGDILHLVGELEEAQAVVEESLAVTSQLQMAVEEVKALFILGNIFQAKGEEENAFESYQQALTTCRATAVCAQTSISLQINLAQINLLLTTQYWQRAQQLLPEIQASLSKLIPSRTDIYQQINFAHLLLRLRHKSRLAQTELSNLPSWQDISLILTDAVKKAQEIGDIRAESYGIGLQGQIKEHQRQWQAAAEFTQQALILSQTIDAPEISYLWQWQLGRILQAQGKPQEAITFYAEAVTLLQSLSQDLVAINPDLQYSFRESVEPVYRELVSLLLKPEGRTEISQANLAQARDVIESLQIAELNNFFREACLDTQTVEIDKVDRQAAVIYPIILRDRLEVILSLPEQPLRHYTTYVNQEELEQVIQQLRDTIVIRSRRQFYSPAQQLYDWLVRPAVNDLANSGIKTLVFVPDGFLRNIPMAALYDGEQYLIEQYNVALTPGLKLLAPRPLKQLELKTLAVGLTKERQGFSALDYVRLELEKIQDQVTSVVLLNEEFTQSALQREIEFSNFPVVHIATHGQFSSTLAETFLLAWDSRINIEQLDQLLQTRTPNQTTAIELLVLSACETATGDKWAALGLAGVAVRAGTRSTVATLWSVNDEATAALMSQFYQELTQERMTKAEAIRQAQLSLLKHPVYRHPFYWAPYVMLGNWL